MTFPKIGITLGDPGGIGPEIILKALTSKKDLPKAQYILFGSRQLLEKEKSDLGINIEIPSFKKEERSSCCHISLYEVITTVKSFQKGSPSKENGKASFRFLEKGFEEAKKRLITALVTAPISKHSWNLAGINWTGHTDYFSHFYPDVIMSFWSNKIKVALFTHHLPLKEAIKRIKKKALLNFFIFLDRILKEKVPEKYHFLVAGLNPHAGEAGLMGSEERDEIFPAIRDAQDKGVSIDGPLPPDIIFREALDKQDVIVIALYHDQGLIPFKLEEFEKGVNVSLGLPFVRTSPDHGTAFNISGQGVANPSSMIEAIKFAHELSIFL